LETVHSILAAWGGLPGFAPPDGTPARLFVWDDPDNDGNPSNAVLLAEEGVVVRNVGTGILNVYELSAPVTVSGKFFVGAAVGIIGTQYPAPQDRTTPYNGESWIAYRAGGALDAENLPNNSWLYETAAGSLPGYYLLNVQSAPPDCNGNESIDFCDVAGGTSADCTANGTPDECEADCNGNDVADSCDIASLASDDCDLNGVPDECEPDCNGNAVADACDVSDGASDDCNRNDVPDECEPDCNANGVTDECEVVGLGWIHNEATGNAYRLSRFGSWGSAEAEAISAGGHLVAIGSPEENQWLSERFPREVWIGFSDAVAEGTWVWSNGEPVTYTNWNGGEPNNAGGGEDFAVMFGGASGSWNDTSNQMAVPGIIEVTRNPNDCNNNGTLDVCELTDGTADDCDGDGVPDVCTVARDGSPDGYALDFQSLSDRVVAAQFANFPPIEITVSMWVNTSDLVRATGLFSYATSSRDNEFLIFDPRNLGFWVRGSALSTGISIADGRWHHLAVSWKSAGGELRVYVDGELRFDGTHAAGAVLSSGGTLVLGDEQDSLGGGFDPHQAFLGQLGDLRVWGVARSQAEISQDSHRPLTGTESGLVGYWPLEEGNGTTAGDLAGDNDGLISGATWLQLSVDCNGNQVPDSCELDDGAASDCNANGRLDQCEPDCNGNAVADSCEIADATAADCDGSGVPDACELADPVVSHRYDDGSSEDGVGFASVNGDLAWLHQFDVAGSVETIVSVSAAWGSPGFPRRTPPEGTSARIFVWDDPDRDGDPTDAVLLAVEDVTVQNVDTGVLNEYQLATPVQISGSLFVGASIHVSAGQYPVPVDADTPNAGQAWFFERLNGPFDPTDLWLLPPKGQRRTAARLQRE
jgi:hypothetical protein